MWMSTWAAFLITCCTREEIKPLDFLRRYQSTIENGEYVVAYVMENESLGAIGRQSEFTGMRIGDGKYPSSDQITDMCAKTTTTNVRYIQHALRG